MISNNFNMMGFLIANSRGKKLSKSVRNRNALLSAFIPGDNFAGLLTPMALVDKEVAIQERKELSDDKANTENFLLAHGSTLTDAKKAELYKAYLLALEPQVSADTVSNIPFYHRISPAVQTIIKNSF